MKNVLITCNGAQAMVAHAIISSNTPELLRGSTANWQNAAVAKSLDFGAAHSFLALKDRSSWQTL